MLAKADASSMRKTLSADLPHDVGSTGLRQQEKPDDRGRISPINLKSKVRCLSSVGSHGAAGLGDTLMWWAADPAKTRAVWHRPCARWSTPTNLHLYSLRGARPPARGWRSLC